MSKIFKKKVLSKKIFFSIFGAKFKLLERFLTILSLKTIFKTKHYDLHSQKNMYMMSYGKNYFDDFFQTFSFGTRYFKNSKTGI